MAVAGGVLVGGLLLARADAALFGGVGVPAFAYGARRQLYVALIEKAFAKLHGCYEALDGGSVVAALVGGAACFGFAAVPGDTK